jgi:hypothetical protein
MSAPQATHFDILAAKKAYAEGRNITELLRAQKNTALNTPEIIETAYDLQAGTYIQHVKDNAAQAALYTGELASILGRHVGAGDSLLDIGTGEMTTLSMVTRGFAHQPKDIYAFDISWSRMFRGVAFAQEKMGADYARLKAFVGDIGAIPLLDKSVNVTTSSHALEPNGGTLKQLMAELFRVTIDKLVLFEPCYEINSEEGRQRMDRLGYIKNMDGIVAELGGTLVEKTIIENTGNPLNPTVCFVITPPPAPAPAVTGETIFSVPGTNMPLRVVDGFYFSDQTGLCYPVLKGIPVLKANAAVLASALGG